MQDSNQGIGQIESGWAQLRQGVVDAGGTDQAGDFDASIDAERSAIAAGDAELLVTVANAQLELVDAIEKVFDDRLVEDAPD